MNAHVEIDTYWCLEQLLQEGRITERDKLLVQTSHRQRPVKVAPITVDCTF